MSEAKKEYEAKAFTVECKLSKAELVCQVKEIQDRTLKESEVHVKDMHLDGCGGVYAEITPEKIKLKGTSLSEDDMKRVFKEDPQWFTEHYAMHIKTEKHRLYAFSTEPYPCE